MREIIRQTTFHQFFSFHDKHDYKYNNGEPRFSNPDYRKRFTIKAADTPGFGVEQKVDGFLDMDQYIVSQIKHFYEENVSAKEPLSAFIYVNDPRRMINDKFTRSLIEMTRVFGISYLRNIIFVYSKGVDYLLNENKIIKISRSLLDLQTASGKDVTEEQYRNIVINHMEDLVYEMYEPVRELLTYHEPIKSLRSGMDEDTWEEFKSMLTPEYFASRTVLLNAWADRNEWVGDKLRDTTDDIKKAMNLRNAYTNYNHDPAKRRVLRDYGQSKLIYLVNQLHQTPLFAPEMCTCNVL